VQWVSLEWLLGGLWTHTTVYNRFNRWSRRGRWQAMFTELVATVPNDRVLAAFGDHAADGSS